MMKMAIWTSRSSRSNGVPFPGMTPIILEMVNLDRKLRLIARDAQAPVRAATFPPGIGSSRARRAKVSDWLADIIGDNGIATDWFINQGSERPCALRINALPPTILPHYTDQQNFQSVLRSGQLPGSGDRVSSARPHVLFAGQRAKTIAA